MSVINQYYFIEEMSIMTLFSRFFYNEFLINEITFTNKRTKNIKGSNITFKIYISFI